MRSISVFLGAVLLAAVLSPAALAADQPLDPSAQRARVFSSEAGQPLSSASESSPAAAVASFLGAHVHAQRTLDSLQQVAENRTDKGLTHLRLEQQVAGLQVYGTYVKASFNRQGDLVYLIENLATPPRLGVQPARVSAAGALERVLQALYPQLKGVPAEADSFGNTVAFDRGDFFYTAPTATRVAIPMVSGAMQEGFLVETWTAKDNQLYHSLVGADGSLLRVESRTAADSYSIFTEHPGTTPQQTVSGPGAGNVESPAGWLFGSGQTTVSISGNNVHAYLDADNNDSADGGGTAVTSGNFTTAVNLSQDPTTTGNKAVAVQNLFYFNNVIHDTLYRHGFTETAGNFQEDNFGKGGAGSDSVNAEGQDGGGTNNANFSTPSDGSNPRMQMYLWTTATPRRDGDVDSDVMWHEYGHGLTWRMIGGMSGPMSGAIGEGMGDVLSILYNNDDVVGEYSTNDPVGIRSAPYTNYPRTYSDFTGSSVHFDGEIYAATIWKLWQLFQANSLPLNTLYDDLVGGMNFTPSGPAFENMRDGILQAAAGSGHECLVWEAFASFGIGVGAKGSVKGGGPFGGGSVSITESFQLPAQCTACTVTEPTEVSCNDGVDNDCDGFIDGADSNCAGGSCTLGQVGDACTTNADCCSNSCKGPSGRKTCK